MCFELLNDISRHLNEKYSTLFIEKINDNTINETAKEIRKNLNKIRNENESKFKDIRNFTIAHRDHNISNQIEIINNMDNEWIMSFALSYLKQIEILHSLMNQTIKYLDSDGKVLGKVDFLKKYSM